jgi:hypothetical protein
MEAVQAKLGLTSGWTAFTPSWNNFTIGDGTDQWYYCAINEMLFITGRSVWGSTTTQTGALQMEIPYGTSIMNVAQPVGSANYLENGSGTNYVGLITTQSTTTLGFREFNVSGSLVSQANVFASSPFTWGANDQIRATMTLRLT